LDDSQCRVLVVYFWWIVMSIQILTNINILTPFIELFYICSGVQKPIIELVAIPVPPCTSNVTVNIINTNTKTITDNIIKVKTQ